jgi:hypothetical protein
MRKLTLLLLAFLALVGCRTRKVTSTEQRHAQKEHFIHYKDSSQLFAYEGRKTDLSHQSDQSFELELESLTDSVGKPRELIYTRIRDGDNEVIRVLNGKVKLRATSTHSKSLQQADSTLTINNKISQKSETKNIYTEHKKEVQKEVRTIPFSLIIGALLLGIFALLLWKLKRFRWKI